MRREGLNRALAGLPERERRMVSMRYGLDGGAPRTLDQVGQAFGTTRERVRQIEMHALRKLKALPDAERLRAVA
jgi:RNA polymerase sigma factor (sigma-70 family)